HDGGWWRVSVAAAGPVLAAAGELDREQGGGDEGCQADPDGGAGWRGHGGAGVGGGGPGAGRRRVRRCAGGGVRVRGGGRVGGRRRGSGGGARSGRGGRRGALWQGLLGRLVGHGRRRYRWRGDGRRRGGGRGCAGVSGGQSARFGLWWPGCGCGVVLG